MTTYRAPANNRVWLVFLTLGYICSIAGQVLVGTQLNAEMFQTGATFLSDDQAQTPADPSSIILLGGAFIAALGVTLTTKAFPPQRPNLSKWNKIKWEVEEVTVNAGFLLVNLVVILLMPSVLKTSSLLWLFVVVVLVSYGANLIMMLYFRHTKAKPNEPRSTIQRKLTRPTVPYEQVRKIGLKAISLAVLASTIIAVFRRK